MPFVKKPLALIHISLGSHERDSGNSTDQVQMLQNVTSDQVYTVCIRKIGTLKKIKK